MNRFNWSDGLQVPGESLVIQQTGVAIYDGHEKTAFDNGNLILTTHQLIWRDARDHNCTLALSLSLVIFLEEQASGFAKSAKIIVHLNQSPPEKPSGPVTHSPHNFIRLSYREAGQREFHRCFVEQLQLKAWEKIAASPISTAGSSSRHRAGIVGIERTIQQRHKEIDKNISQSFQDLSKLIDKAKEMVTLSKKIATKIREKQGSISEDETIRFKSYLLSMGIPDPVTKETHGTGARFYTELAKQLTSMLQVPLQECGGMMTLTDVYCRVNRARGMELLSPEDLLNGCNRLESIGSPIRLRRFNSGVLVLQMQSHSESEVIQKTIAMVKDKGSMTADELAQAFGVSVILAKERLLLTENVGGVCRDESIEGMRFYPNLFLTKAG